MFIKVYGYECGVLVEPGDSEFEAYSMPKNCEIPNLPYGFYDEEQSFFPDHLFPQIKEQVLNYVKDGVDKTYAIISFQDIYDVAEAHEILKNEDISGTMDYSFFSDKSNILYSVCKINGEIQEGFLEKQLDAALGNKKVSSCPNPDVVKNLIAAVCSYGQEVSWCDGEIIDAFLDLGLTQEDFIRAGAERFANEFFAEHAEFFAQNSPEVLALQGDISNLRHELDGIAGYPGEEELAPVIEKNLFIRECQLIAAMRGFRLDEQQLNALELNDALVDEINNAGSLEEYLENSGILISKVSLDDMIQSAATRSGQPGFKENHKEPEHSF